MIAGTVNGAGSLRVQVTGTGEQTALAGIMRLVEQAQTSRSRAQALADRAAFWLTIVAIVAGAVTFVAWMALRGDPAFAVERLVTVLVISCPHALGLAVPARHRHLDHARRAGRAARARPTRARGGAEPHRRRLRQDRHADARRVRRGRHHDRAMESPSRRRFGWRPPSSGIRSTPSPRASSAPRRSADRRRRRRPSFEAIPGVGVSAESRAGSLLMGGPALLTARSVEVPDALQTAMDEAAQAGAGGHLPGRGARGRCVVCRPWPSSSWPT